MRALERNQRNGLRVGELLLIFSAGGYAIGFLGQHDVATPLLALPILPIFAIHVAEKRGTMQRYVGLTVPVIFVLAASCCFVWARGAPPEMQAILIIASFITLIAALLFLGIRMWTVEGNTT